MSRSFRGKTPATSWVLVGVLMFVAGYSAWERSGILMALSLVVLVVVIDRIIHTEYTLTGGELQIHRGRFASIQTVRLSDIQKIDEVSGTRIGGKPLTTFLMLTLEGGREVIVSPRDVQSFIEHIQKQRYSNENNEKDNIDAADSNNLDDSSITSDE